jgi:hypothetical protein
MCGKPGLEDEAETAILEREETILDRYRLPYLRDTFWKDYTENPVWCSLDIEKFYPSVSLDLVRKQILQYSESALEIGSETLTALTSFRLDLSGWTGEHLSSMNIASEATEQAHIPTGLMIAGFLANAAMLDIDGWVSTQINERQVAHFRYVDDHVILAPDLDTLVNWVRTYTSRLSKDTGCKINIDKLEPEGLSALVTDTRSLQAPPFDLLKKMQLDPEFPIPLMTKTLAKVSDIARTNFDLLTQEGQQRFLDDLEHLLLAPLPETELATKTRVTFAAGKIARFAPKQERGQDVYFAAWNKVLELNGVIKSLDSRLQAFRPDSREAKSMKILRRKKRAEQRIAVIVLDQEQQKIKQAREKEMQRTLKILSKALREQYDKLRLWQRILDFGKSSGVNHVAAVLREIDEIEPRLAAVLIKAKVLQLHAHNVLICSAIVLDETRTHDSRVAALEYLRDVFQPANLNGLLIGKISFYHEKLSRNLLIYSLHLCRDILESNTTLNEPVLNREWKKVRLLTKGFTKLKAPRGDGYIWWREKILFHLHINLSSSQRVTSRLSPKDSASWLIWECHPSFIPLTALGMLLTGQITIEPGSAGWLRDLIISRAGSKRQKFIEQLKPAPKSIAAKVLKSARQTFTLFEWAAWIMRLRESDPRASEWTVLEICRQICILLRDDKLDDRTRLIFSSHASNFLVPSSWWNEASRFGWKEWEDVCTSDPVMRVNNPIADYRVAAALGIFVDSPTEFSLVRAIGSLLLGLLRHNFIWPMPWRVIGVQATLRGNIAKYLQTRPCSSRTLSILEATLLARPYESWLLANQEISEIELSDDTAQDPPSIVTLDDLRLAIEKSMKTLAKYRLTVTELEPRQLVPIRIAQYTKESWDQEDDGEFIG